MFVPLPLQKLVLFFMLTPTLHYSLHPTLTLAEKSPYEERIESCFWREINATIFDLSGAGVLLIWIIFFQKKYCALTRGLNTLPIGVQRELNVQNGSRNSKILTFIFPICWLFILCRISIICTVQYTILFLCISFTEYPSNIFFLHIFWSRTKFNTVYVWIEESEIRANSARVFSAQPLQSRASACLSHVYH